MMQKIHHVSGLRNDYTILLIVTVYSFHLLRKPHCKTVCHVSLAGSLHILCLLNLLIASLFFLVLDFIGFGFVRGHVPRRVACSERLDHVGAAGVSALCDFRTVMGSPNDAFPECIPTAKLWDIYTMEYYLAVKKGILPLSNSMDDGSRGYDA